ncbi:MAG TPA: DUF1707 domain-containing protein [Streptosporangiaceae bacterium]|nr:DUF1707 domain-containing protein [Streptosporangiaceae bacterium]
MNAAKDHQPSGLRVSDSDRDRAIAELSEHFQAGRITTDELEERTGRALRARTASDLAELFTDLPRKPAPTGGPAPRMTPGTAPALPPASAPPARSGGVPVIPLVVVAFLVLGGFISGHSIVAALVPVLIVLFVIRRIVDGGHHEHRDRARRRGDRW